MARSLEVTDMTPSVQRESAIYLPGELSSCPNCALEAAQGWNHRVGGREPRRCAHATERERLEITQWDEA